MNGVICCTLIILFRIAEPVFWDYFCRKTSWKETYTERKNYFALGMLIAAIVAKNSIGMMVDDIRPVAFIVNNMYLVIYYLYAVKAFRLERKIVVCSLSIYDIACVMIEYVYSYLIMAVMKIADSTTIMQAGGIRVTSFVIITILNSVILVILANVDKDYTNAMMEDNVFCMLRYLLIMDMSMFFLFSVVPGTGYEELFNICTFIGLICEASIVVYALKSILDVVNEKRCCQINLNLANSRIEMLIRRQHGIESSRKVMHDTRNHIHTIGYLLEHKMYDEAFHYVSGLNVELKDAAIGGSGDNVMEILLYQKKKYANSLGVQFEYLINIKDTKIAIVDVSKLIFNIADNAIEYCVRHNSNEYGANFGIYIMNDSLVFECYNKCDDELEKDDNGNILTTKQDNIHHGKGISIINEVVQKYNGVTTIQKEMDLYILQASFPKELAVVTYGNEEIRET